MLRPPLFSALAVLAVSHCVGMDAVFPEKYALAPDRTAVLKELIPGTDDYYYYHALHYQVQNQAGELAAILKAWTEKFPDENARRSVILTRQMLLDHSTDPAKSLARIKEKLQLSFDHQRQTDEARAELPTVLDPAAIAFEVFEKQAVGNAESLENVTDIGLYRLTLPVEKWKPGEIRALLSRLKRPDFPGLVDVIDRELKEKDAAFGMFPIHTLLTSEQLEELQRRRPELLNNETFTAAVMTRMRPLEFEDPERDPAVREAWLNRLWAYAATLNPNANPLKANLLYHLLALDEKLGRLDEKRLLAYLKLPRPVPYVNPRYKEDRDIWKFPAKLDYDPSSFSATDPVGDDEPLVRRLVIRYLTKAENWNALVPLVSDPWLRSALAEAKLLSGAPESQRWVSLLTPEAYQALRDRTDIEFDPASPQSWARDDVVKLEVWVKNVPSLLVRIYEINTANVHRTGEEVNTGLDLDGLTANHERKLDINAAPILRQNQTFTFPELSAPRGVWIIEFIGNGKASRALIRKGGLRPVVRQTSAGTVVTVLDEKLKPVPAAFAMIGPKQFKADDKGLILLPLSTQPGPQKVILDDGSGFTALETIELQGENYTLAAGFHVPRESLLPGAKATLLIRPRLQSNGRPVLLESLEKAKVTVASVTLDGTPASVVIPVEKLAEDKETTVEFAVPDRLKSLTFTLSGEVKSTLTGTPVQLSVNDSLKVNTISMDDFPDTTTPGDDLSTAVKVPLSMFYDVKDVHLSRNAGGWLLQYLGLNGEPYGNEEITVEFHRPEFTQVVEVEMKTDASGSIQLGSLDGIACLDAYPRTFSLPKSGYRLPDTIHLIAGQPLSIPWTGGNPMIGDVLLIEVIEDCVRKQLPTPRPAGGYLTWKDLAPGTYTLHLQENQHIIRIAPGEAIEGQALAATSTVQITANRPLTITDFQEGEAKLPDGKTDAVLIVHVGNISPETRVHILTSRFLPEFDAMSTLGAFTFAAPSFGRASWQPSLYLSSRNIGDEYRYVLERRTASRFAGNMLARPGLLINPWEIAETKMEKEVLEVLEKARESELLPKAELPADSPHGHEHPDPAAAGSFPQTPTTPPPGKPDLSFLATPAPALLNLRPDAAGNVIISRAALGDRQYVRVLAIDRESSAARDFSLPAAALPPRDQRLARQLNPGKHFSRQNRITVLEKDAPFGFGDALAAQFQALGHLGAVQQLFFNLTQNPLLNEFSWLLEWPSFAEEKKRSLYSQYACHELNFFLQRKDRTFFDAVVKPFLASKRERTFMDDYLLESDLARYLAPWPYGRLNALERLLLAQRIENEQPAARRLADHWMNVQPMNRERDMFLFETALRGTALIADRSEAEGKVAANVRYDWYFDTGESGETLRRLEGRNFFLTAKSNAPEMTVFGTPRGETYQIPVSGVSEQGRRITRADDGLIEADLEKNWSDHTDLYTDLNRPEKGDELTKHFNKGVSHYKLGQFNEAQAEFSRMLTIDPSSAAAQRGLARAQQEVAASFKTGRDVTRLFVPHLSDDSWTKSGRIDPFAAPNDSQGVDYGAGGALDRRKHLYGFEGLEDRFGTNKLPGGAESLLGWEYRRSAPTRGFGSVPNRGSNDFLETADFDTGLGLVPDAAYLTRFKSANADGTARLFRQQDQTKVWAEQQYYRLPLDAQTAQLVPMNRFWRDYAVWDGKSAFLSTNMADAAGTFSEMVLALAVLDLPFPGDYKAGKVDTKENVLTLTPTSRLLLFHQDILPAEPDDAGAKLLVSQNFYREGDRYIEQAGEKTDKFITAEFLTGTVYGCQVVVTNPSSSRQRLDVLFQIPAGSLPVKATRRVQSVPVQIDSYRTQTLDFHFYFPQPGTFAHFPVHVSRDMKTAASAAPFVFNVVSEPTTSDLASWEYVSQHGTTTEVLSFLEQHNLYFLALDKILWRMKDADFFRGAIAHLKSRHVFHAGIWSYAVLHNTAPYLTEFLMASEMPKLCGPVFESPLLTVEPVEQQSYQHLEYSPLVNARAHRLGGTRSILNDKFRAQWNSLLNVLSFRSKLSAEDCLAVAGYLALQDRIDEALGFFAKVDRTTISEKLQYEYLRAWLAMCQEDTTTARRIATALAAHPVDHWRAKFAALNAQLDELEGKPFAPADMADREASHDSLADRDPAISLAVENKTVVLKYRNLSDVRVSYYPIDLEFLFSSRPFVSQDAARFGVIRPKLSESIMLPTTTGSHIVALPAAFQSDNVLVEVTGGGVTKAAAVYANSLDVQISESFGQLTVQHDRKPVPKTYVKVIAEVNGAPAFYKDGYTDLRGKFDYASLGTDDLNGARRFAILVMSDSHGAVVREVKPPAR